MTTRLKSLIKVWFEIIPVASILAVSVIILRSVLFNPGLIMWGNFVSPLETDKYLAHFYPMWNKYGGFPVFSDMTLWVMWPIITLASLLHISSEWFFKLLMLGTTMTMGLSMYVSARVLVHKISQDSKVGIVASFTATMVYMLNPWVMANMSHLVFLMSYALTPLVLVCFMKALENGKVKYVLSTVLLWSFATLTPQYPIFIGILIISWLIFSVSYEIINGNASTVLSDIRVTGIILVLYFAFNLFWLVPHLASGFISPGYDIRLADLDHLSRNGSILNVIRFMGFWEPASTAFYEPAVRKLHYFWLAGGYLMPILATTPLFIYFKNKRFFKYVLFFSLMSVLFIFLSGGTKGLFPMGYKWMIFDIPFFSGKFGWLLREPNKTGGLLALMFSSHYPSLDCIVKNGTLRISSGRAMPPVYWQRFSSRFSGFLLPRQSIIILVNTLYHAKYPSSCTTLASGQKNRVQILNYGGFRSI